MRQPALMVLAVQPARRQWVPAAREIEELVKPPAPRPTPAWAEKEARTPVQPEVPVGRDGRWRLGFRRDRRPRLVAPAVSISAGTGGSASGGTGAGGSTSGGTGGAGLGGSGAGGVALGTGGVAPGGCGSRVISTSTNQLDPVCSSRTRVSSSSILRA